MKRVDSSKKFPTSPAEIEAAIARAPGKDRAFTAKEEATWSTGILVRGGGYEAVRQALAQKRLPGQRGPQIAPTKTLVSVRYSPEVVDFFKAGGVGWQTRMDDALKQFVAKHSKPARSRRPSEA